MHSTSAETQGGHGRVSSASSSQNPVSQEASMRTTSSRHGRSGKNLSSPNSVQQTSGSQPPCNSNRLDKGKARASPNLQDSSENSPTRQGITTKPKSKRSGRRSRGGYKNSSKMPSMNQQTMRSSSTGSSRLARKGSSSQETSDPPTSQQRAQYREYRVEGVTSPLDVLEDRMLAILDFYREIRALVHHGIKAHQVATQGNVTTVAAQAILRETADSLRNGMRIGDQLVLLDRLDDLISRELRQQRTNRTAEIP